MKKILVTPRSFAKFNQKDVELIFKDHDIDVTYNPVGRILTEDEMVENLRDMDGLIVGVDPVTERVLQHAPNLRAIAKYGVGVDNIDLKYARKNQISISTTVHANSNAVADYTFALILAVARKVVPINNEAKNGNWDKQLSLDIYGKTIGVIGLGAIGKGVVSRAKGFNMNVLGYDLYHDDQYLEENNVTFMSVDEIIAQSDVITLHLPLTETTENLLNRENLKAAKPSLIIINTARGGLIDELALYEMLKEGKLYGAGIDAFEAEPPMSSPLLELDNVIVGSHTAAGSQGATNEMTRMAVENIIKDLGA